MTIKWRDTFTECNSDLDIVKESIKNNTGIATSYGKIVFQNKDYIVLNQNNFKDIEKHSDFIVIPKSCIIKIK